MSYTTGHGLPDAESGVPNDYYLDIDTQNVYWRQPVGPTDGGFDSFNSGANSIPLDVTSLITEDDTKLMLIMSTDGGNSVTGVSDDSDVEGDWTQDAVENKGDLKVAIWSKDFDTQPSTINITATFDGTPNWVAEVHAYTDCEPGIAPAVLTASGTNQQTEGGSVSTTLASLVLGASVWADGGSSGYSPADPSDYSLVEQVGTASLTQVVIQGFIAPNESTDPDISSSAPSGIDWALIALTIPGEYPWAIAYNTGQEVLNSNALCTVDEALTYMKLNRVTGPQADDLQALLPTIINAVSDAIITATGREFFPTDDVTRTFVHSGGHYINIYPYELRSITSLTLGGFAMTEGDGSGVGDYLPFPRNQTTQGTYLYLVLRDYLKVYSTHSLYSAVLNERDVVITGDWGMEAVPPAVKLACLEAVSLTWHDPEMVNTSGAGQFQIVNPTADGSEMLFSDRIMGLLNPFIRPLIG